MHTRAIPSSGAPLPVVGCGTWEGFDVSGGKQERAALGEVLSTLFRSGGSVIDSSPMYGQAERIVGELLAAGNSHDAGFVATKVWTRGRQSGIEQMRRSFDLLGRIDLMQVHNLVDWRTHLVTLREWKAQRRIRYIGVTHYTASAYPELEQVLRTEAVDFVQLNYSLEERTAETRLLPLAADRGIGVIVNLPFGAGRLLRALREKPLPGWAGECGCTSWAVLLLKFILSVPSVTCVIPGTGNPRHMLENSHAGFGNFLTPGQRDALRQIWDRECR